MNIAVVGLGSMGKRRIRLLKDYISNTSDGKDVWNIVGIDSRADRRTEAECKSGIDTSDSLDKVLGGGRIDAVFVSTSPLSHPEIIKKSLMAGAHVFSEINLVPDGYDENISLASDKNLVLFLSSTPMYRREMQYIKEFCAYGFKGTYRYHIGQYLPAWHPWENYKDFFAGEKKTNGCRELFAIELPWITDTFGNVKNIYTIRKKVSDLEIKYDDVFQVILEHETGITGSMTVDVISPQAERELKIWNQNTCITWKGTPDTLTVYNRKDNNVITPELYPETEHDDMYAGFVLENAYYDEIVDFFDCILKSGQGRYSFEDDKTVLRLIDRIGA